MVVYYLAWVALQALLALTLIVSFLIGIVVVRHWLLPSTFPSLKKSCFYVGRVKHSRLKGGAVHHLNYPIFFTFVDLQELREVGWSFWPLFKVNAPWTALSSFDECQHLKDFSCSTSCSTDDFLQKVHSFVKEKSKGNVVVPDSQSVQLLTHLTYFGYCFNPISLYYVFQKDSKRLETVIAEVSNTPWIEMHSYLLHESVPNCKIERLPQDSFRAVWRKEFHVSPFMEMDYEYDFNIFPPADNVCVQSKMIKLATKDVWFTASFDLERLEFSPLNLLYVLVAYPLQTRLIQLYIHWEAVKLFWKGVPTFDHPQGTDVNFGLGITGKRLTALYTVVVDTVCSLFSRNKSN